MQRLRAAVLCFLFTAFLSCLQSKPAPLILVSIDAMRWDYLEIYQPPTLSRLAREGFRVVQLLPAFPSKTFPNHVSIATGLRAEHHGIIANEFLDPETGRWFTKRSEKNTPDDQWWRGEPIWITAEKQGLKAANLFWVGGQAEIDGHVASICMPYDESLPNLERVHKVLGWLDLPEAQRPGLVTLYFSVVDTAGHHFGPVSRETGAALAEVDQALGVLREGLEKRGLLDSTNLIVVSDHGMTEISPERLVYIDDVLTSSDPVPEFLGPIAGLRAEGAQAAELETRLKRLGHVRVFSKESLPPDFGYSESSRIPGVLVLADEGWEIATRAKIGAYGMKNRGDHGYDSSYGSMAATLIARGPAFTPGSRMQSVENIHIYTLLCALLELKPARNDGDARLLKVIK